MPTIKKAFLWYFKACFLKKLHNYKIAYFLMIFDKVHLLFGIRIRILQKVSDAYGSGFGSGSTTLEDTVDFIHVPRSTASRSRKAYYSILFWILDYLSRLVGTVVGAAPFLLT
jgi:hypothetical protein